MGLELLTLPLEIRNCIYRFLLVPEDGRLLVREETSANWAQWRRSSYTEHFSDPSKRTTYRMGSPVSLQVFYLSRQLYEETSRVFYSENCFYLYRINVLVPFLKDRPSRALGLIRTISIPTPYGIANRPGIYRSPTPDTRTRRLWAWKWSKSLQNTCAAFVDDPSILPELRLLEFRMWHFTPDEQPATSFSTGNMALLPPLIARLVASMNAPEAMTLCFFRYRAELDVFIRNDIFTSPSQYVHHKVHWSHEDILRCKHVTDFDANWYDNYNYCDRTPVWSEGKTGMR